jgi:hypothetical protein
MRRTLLAAALIALACGGLAQDAKPAAEKSKEAPARPDAPKGDLTPLEIKLPRPAFKGTPKDVPPGTNLEKPRSGPRPAFLAPKGTSNVALNRPVKSSDSDPIIGAIKMVTDGDKEANEGSYVELGPGLQWVQIDLGKEFTVYAAVLWHFHGSARVYHDVVVQTADDAEFIRNVKTHYSNDHDNSSGLGVGEEKEYWETNEGRLVDMKGVKARYVRVYSKGSTADDQNHYTEVEVYGKE